MARFRASFGRILTIGGLAAATGTVAVYRSELTDRAATAYAQNLDGSSAGLDEASNPPQTAWDHDWDRRSTFSDLTKAMLRKNVNSSDDKHSYITVDKHEEPMRESSNGNKEGNSKRAKATRHLIFVRHGQYNSGKKHDEDKTLTDLGRSVLVTGFFSLISN